MSSSLKNFGMQPLNNHPSMVRSLDAAIASAYPTNIFKFQPVRYGTAADGASLEGKIVPALPGERMIGVFIGVEYTGSNGRRFVSPYWPANTIATDIVAYITSEADVEYLIQANGSLTEASIGNQYDISAVTGSTSTGLASVTLNVGSAATNAGLRVIGVAKDIDNAWGDAFTFVRVKIAEHQNRADVAAY